MNIAKFFKVFPGLEEDAIDDARRGRLCALRTAGKEI
jgi:hypothetical protein